MRPLLGTFVEVRVRGLSERNAAAATDRAFAQIATVDVEMSAHDTNSDLGRLFRAKRNEVIAVHPWTWQVIEAARKLYRLSGGIFDVTVGDVLEAKGLLPQWRIGPGKRECATMADIELLDGHRIRVRCPPRLDLGGIAKGFAVDRAVEALIEAGARGGYVNAGGDFRIFGDDPEPLLVRHPTKPGLILRAGEIRTGAAATSAGYFHRRRWRARPLMPLIDGRSRKAKKFSPSVTVLAPSCMWADALTKLLALEPETAEALLNRFGARAVLLADFHGEMKWRFLPSRSEISKCSAVNI